MTVSALTLDTADKLYKSGVGSSKSVFQFVYDLAARPQRTE